MTEWYYDELLNIETEEIQEGFHKSFHYHRYEPTPYSALETLFQSYRLQAEDHVVDFGCGKGRLNFYINYWFHATVIGVEMNEEFYNEAMENREGYLEIRPERENQIQFEHCLAQDYKIQPKDNRFYFFNPFSIQIFMNVINNILRSIEEHNREVDVILYYSSEDYMYFLENQTAFELIHEVTLPGEYESNAFEKFLVYRLSY
ncbi:SAM-dependent methyltransferase [Ectobacillus sp. JY-23]|uniref:methyltransferase n=1 Tax=Ectobacillus sp. JY-23 TaxID=2933872 RepID=UPI001FF5CF01|nr:methyltransferase [Ectobacillus sp. JY-23]UOY91784.1 SAM-dependent methyltransferase [Ectobacillus sp. JY-23]